MAKYSYEVIIDKLLQTKVGNGIQKPEIVVVHHTNIETNGEYDVIKRLNELAQRHIRNLGNGGLAYHFYIPRNESNTIYVTRYLNQIQWHCSNAYFNTKSLGVLMEGDFDKQKPTPTQLKKLKQLLDELPMLFGNPDLELIQPKDSQTVRKGSGVELRGGLFYHGEVAEPGYATTCAGINLIPYVVDYRLKHGNVDWEKALDQTMVKQIVEQKVSDEESSMNFIAGNLNSRIQLLEKEKTNLVNEIEQTKKFIQNLESKIHQLDFKVISLQSENKNLLEERDILQEELQMMQNKFGVINGSSNGKPIAHTESKSWNARFIRFWDTLPVWVRYSVPNILAAILPIIIIVLEELRFEDWNNTVTIGFAGLVFGIVKSLIIGLLRELEEKVK